jgi:uncharacterized lipoprotein NlpE involved in copper resistance
MRVILVIVFTVLSLGAYAQKLSPRDTITDVYKGVLPCGDCSGIETELSLKHERYAGMGTFVLKEVYSGKDTTVFETIGEWTHHRGIPGNNNATAIDLYNANEPDNSRYYLILKDGNLRLLDKDLRMIKSEGNYVLTKVK